MKIKTFNSIVMTNRGDGLVVGSYPETSPCESEVVGSGFGMPHYCVDGLTSC